MDEVGYGVARAVLIRALNILLVSGGENNHLFTRNAYISNIVMQLHVSTKKLDVKPSFMITKHCAILRESISYLQLVHVIRVGVGESCFR